MRTANIIFRLLILAVAAFTCTLLFAGGYSTSSSAISSWDGYIIPPKGNHHILIIYVNIIYDTAASDPVANNDIWPQSQTEGINVDTASWPVYINDLIDVEYLPGQTHGMMTRLFAESSFDSLIVTGDCMVVNLKHTTISNGGKFDNIALFDTVVSFINQHGGLNTIHGKSSITDFSNIDSTRFDCITFIVRNSTSDYGFFGVGNGSAGAGDWIKLLTGEGKKFSAFSSTVQCVGNTDISKNPTSIVVHEFSHLLFGGNSFHTSGGHSWGGRMCFPGIQYGYGLMGGASSGLVNCNGYDRYRVGWTNAENTTGWPVTASGVLSNICKEGGNQSFILRDFISTGDVVRIKLPFIELPASNQYIWLENHKMLESNLSFLQYQNTHDCRPEAQKGIYAYYQVGKDTLEGTRNSVYTGYDADNLKIICANGFYDQQYLGTIPGNCINTGPFNYFIDQAPNPLSGNNDLSAYFIDITGDDTLKPSLHAKNAMAKTYYHSPADTVKNLPYLMSNINAFNGLRELSLNTNPAPFNTKTYYHNPTIENNIWVTKPKDEFRNLTEVYLSGLKIVMTPLENDDYQVDITWDNFSLENNVRWTGNIALIEELYVQDGVTLLLNQNRTANTIYRDPESGLFSAPTRFRCAGGSIMVQQDGSNVVLDNKSKLLLEIGSHYLSEGGMLNILNESILQVESGGIFEQRGQSAVNIHNESTLLIEQGGHYIIDGGITSIKSGGRLEIESCATIEIRNGGLLSVESFGEICIHPGAFIIIDSMANLNFAFGFSTGECIGFTPANFEEVVIALPPTHSIQGTTDWQNATFNFTEDLIINPAATFSLTRGSELRFAPGKKIIVERGATLNLSDSKITNLCANHPWGGIEVWGDVSKSQSEYGSQGMVNISDRAVIENAAIGVVAGKTLNEPGDQGISQLDPAYGGGIIVANSAIFRNNQTGIYLTPYENKNSAIGLVLHNAGRISNCEFLCSSDIFNEQVFIKLNSVRGVETYGNLFHQLPSLKASSTGILSINSAFTVKGLIVEEPFSFREIQPSVFMDLNYGIRALGIGSEKTFLVDSAHFINNSTGIYTSANNHFSVIRSYFKMRGLSSSNPRKAGLYVDDHVSGLEVTENKFVGAYTGFEIGTGLSFGATFNNTGGYPNLIYNNQFDSLHVAVHAMNHNLEAEGYSGLGVRCNDFAMNRHAILMINDSTSRGGNGIAPYQGNAEVSACNTFMPSALWEAHIYNHGAPLIYFHPDTSSTQLLVKPGKITPDSVFLFSVNQAYNEPDCCPSDSVSWQEDGYEKLKNSYEGMAKCLRIKEEEYFELVDGGDTGWLLGEINFAQASDALRLHKQLMKLSPWLSDSVLIAAIKAENILPKILTLDILKANPQLVRSTKVLDAVFSRFGRLSEITLKVIAGNAQSLSAKEVLEAEILTHQQEKQKALIRLAIFLMNDTSDLNSREKLLNLMIEQHIPEFWYMAAIMLIEQGNIFDAAGIINTMPEKFGTQQSGEASSENVMAFITKMYALGLTGKSLFVPDSTTIQWLIEAKNDWHQPVATYARNILIANNVIEYKPIFLYPLQVGPLPDKPPVDSEVPPRLSVMKVFPNPAMNYVIVDYDVCHLPESQNESSSITFSSMDGKRVSTIALDKNKNQVLIPLGGYPAGVYMLGFHFAGRQIEVVKVVVLNR
jgi:hypothetical protein